MARKLFISECFHFMELLELSKSDSWCPQERKGYSDDDGVKELQLFSSCLSAVSCHVSNLVPGQMSGRKPASLSLAR